jgi:hypothetical protein
MMRRGLAALAAVLLLLPAARSSPLDKEGCAQLKVEQGELERAGTRASMGRGPQWAKTNLEPAKLEQIKRLLEVDEQLLFRCGGRSLVNLPKDPDPDPAAREPGHKAAKAPQAPKVPKAQRQPKKEAAAAPAKEPAPAAGKAPAAKAAPASPKAADKGDPAAEKKKDAQKTAAAKKAKAKAKEANEPAITTDPFTFRQQ